jgi:hypothetical protein
MYIISININAQPNIDYSRDITTCHNKPNNWIKKSFHYKSKEAYDFVNKFILSENCPNERKGLTTHEYGRYVDSGCFIPFIKIKKYPHILYPIHYIYIKLINIRWRDL